MKSLVLHIGIPKTGSSALQVFFAQNRDALLTQAVDYFAVGEFSLGARGKISSGNGSHLSRSFVRPGSAGYKDNRDELLAALNEQLAASGADTGLLSSEIFVFADDAALASFRDWLSARGVRLRFFYFIRNQIQFLTSTYIQQVKRHACTETPEEHILGVYQKIQHIKYSRLFDRLSKIVAPEDIICRSYDEASVAKNGLYETFLKSFALEHAGITFPEKSVNVSLDLNEITIMLLLNKLKPRMRFSDYIVENSVRRGRKTTDVVHHLLSSKAVETLESYFAEDNARFARSYFDREKLFDDFPTNIDTPRLSGTDLSFSDLIDTFGGLLVRFDERLAALERKLKLGVDHKED